MREARRVARSSSLALGLVISLLLLISVVFSIYTLIAATDPKLQAETEAAILSESLHLSQELEQSANPSIRFYQFIASQTNRNYLYALRDEHGECEEQVCGNVLDWPSNPSNTENGFFFFESRLNQTSQNEPHQLIAKISNIKPGLDLLVARNVDDLFFAQSYARGFSWALSATLLAFAIASIVVGVYVFDRMSRVADTAMNIAETGDLSQRLPVDSTWDDLSKMSMTLNLFLDELEEKVHATKNRVRQYRSRPSYSLGKIACRHRRFTRR